MRARLCLRVVLPIMLATAGVAGAQDKPPDAPKDPTTLERELMAELTQAYSVGVEESTKAYAALWKGVKEGTDDNALWSNFVDAYALKFAEDNGVLLDKELHATIRKQFNALKGSLDQEDAVLLLSANPTLKDTEAELRKQLAVVAAAADSFLQKHQAELSAAGVKTGDLSKAAKDALSAVKDANELFSKVKKVETVTIKGSASWQSSGVKVKDGETVRILAVGRMNAGGFSGGWETPAGTNDWPEYRVVPKANYGSLIARIEGMEVEAFPVGSNSAFKADRTGIVLFRPNSKSEMTGSYVAIVAVERKKKGKDEDDDK